MKVGRCLPQYTIDEHWLESCAPLDRDNIGVCIFFFFIRDILTQSTKETCLKRTLTHVLQAWDRHCLEDSELKDDLINELMNDKAVYRTVPATAGVLKIRF